MGDRERQSRFVNDRKSATARDIGGYLRCLVEYGAISQAIKLATNCVDEETKK
ncbi:hypothetical protein KIN20_031194, partial [Parelaphostrongylus tenuis]